MHTTAWSELLADTDAEKFILSAAVRGGSGDSAAVTGVIETAVGLRIGFSSAINTASVKYQNMLWNGRALGLVWKSEMQLDAWDSRDNKALRIAAGADFDTALLYETETALMTVGT